MLCKGVPPGRYNLVALNEAVRDWEFGSFEFDPGENGWPPRFGLKMSHYRVLRLKPQLFAFPFIRVRWAVALSTIAKALIALKCNSVCH